MKEGRLTGVVCGHCGDRFDETKLIKQLATSVNHHPSNAC